MELAAKEKAKELVNKYYQSLGYLVCGVNNNIMWEHSKQCAKISMQNTIEILNSLLYFDNEETDLCDYILRRINIQEEILQEINNL